ncbi:MAG: S9 family peptidase [Bdellovibrionales bacterium]|nr:S9 family peptidase [Bdellovibrionales bacterium]
MGGTQAGRIPIEDFFKNPEVRSFSISPNGEYLAYLKPFKSRMNVFVQKVGEGNSVKRLTNQTDRDIAGFFWKENSTIIFVRDFGGDENFHLFRVGVDGTGERDLTPFKETRARVIDDLDKIDSEHMIISMNKRDKKVFDAYRLNIKTGELKMIAQNPGNYSGWLTDHNGKLRVATVTDGVNTSIFYRDKEGQKFKNLITTNFKTSLSPLFFTFDNKRLYMSSNMKRDKSAIVVFDPKTKKETSVLYKRDDVDVTSLDYSKKRKVLTHASFVTWKRELNFFDNETKAIYEDLRSKLPGFEVVLGSSDTAETTHIVRTYSDKSQGAYYLYNSSTKVLSPLGELSPWLDTKKMAAMKPIQYKSRDGLMINGYLTLPNGMENAKKLPTVVLPHGGPWARDVWGYRPDIQFLANRGYAVLQMNFRGSTGYGRKFWEASFKKWGKEMQNDITDGVNYLVEQGVADKDRVGIYGGSYGGYAVLAGLAFTPDVYACGVDYVGVSNIFTLMETIPPYWEQYREMFYEMVGHPKNDKALLTEVSPVFHADKITAPLMVVQGAKDPRVKKSESDQIVEALKKRGIDVPYIVKDNEGHGFRNEENKMEMYSKMEEFFGKHLL